MQLFLLGLHSFLTAVFKHGKLTCERLTLRGIGLPVKVFFIHPARHVARRIGRVNAEALAEAGLVRLRAGERDNGSHLAPGSVERVDRLFQKYLVENFKASRVARAHTKDRERPDVLARLKNFDRFPFPLESGEVLHLREKEVFCRARGIEPLGERRALLPGSKLRLTGRVVLRQIERLLRRDGGKETVQFFQSKLLHPFTPPLS